ncbi:hypothetical protein CYY_006014 [Polysphondylium violaceum]|uniref:Molybdate-anion transporter n=1 Tax=Polysphondylium violaceum TaxID=133409 RepID=A0A8J4PTD0_9MYCE|nr:hypothetical protein CYY_006014 [Polysphondylium violaceum]
MNFLNIFVFFCLLCTALQLYIYKKNSATKKNGSNTNNDIEDSPSNPSTSFLSNEEKKKFSKFQIEYLTVYLLAMAADWLQGPYVYALYESYGFSKPDIAILFIIGFVSSLLFGMIVGPITDKYGRKLMTIVFCLLYSISCITKLLNNFSVLLFGRLLGGIATSLLFSVFESWMVYEHNFRGYDPELLSSTFYKSTLLNGVVAIVSGLWASDSANRWGFVSPFLWAILLLIICGLIVLSQWSENYGDNSNSSRSNNSSHSNNSLNNDDSLSSKFFNALQFVKEDQSVLKLGATQSLFESSMYTFVFMWTPTLSETGELGALPFGLIFATFMVCVMIGSSLFNLIPLKPESLIQVILLVSSLALLIPAFFNDSFIVYGSFLIFEVCCGLYFPCVGTLRSAYIPESMRATIMNLFRVPLNLLVVLILVNVSSLSNDTVFLVCSIWLLIAYVLQKYILKDSKQPISLK